MSGVVIDILLLLFGRKFPPEEVQAITWMLSNLLTCNMTSFPPEMYGHHFWDWSHGLQKYSKCIYGTGLLKMAKRCHYHVQPSCANRFAGRGVDTARCFQNLWQPFWRRINSLEENTSIPPLDVEDAKNFKLYRECVDTLKEPVTQCQTLLQGKCHSSTIRATKIVRGSMGTLDKLMKLMPNLQIVHLFRDPRGVVRSRKNIGWSQGHYDGKNISKLAQTYCKRVSMDSHQRKLMQAKYPNRILELVYDKMAEDPLNSIRSVYTFLGINMTQGAVTFIRQSMKKSHAFKVKWSKELSDVDIVNIQRYCQEFTAETGFDW